MPSSLAVLGKLRAWGLDRCFCPLSLLPGLLSGAESNGQPQHQGRKGMEVSAVGFIVCVKGPTHFSRLPETQAENHIRTTKRQPDLTASCLTLLHPSTRNLEPQNRNPKLQTPRSQTQIPNIITLPIKNTYNLMVEKGSDLINLKQAKEESVCLI